VVVANQNEAFVSSEVGIVENYSWAILHTRANCSKSVADKNYWLLKKSYGDSKYLSPNSCLQDPGN
jgi:hypothetical protein